MGDWIFPALFILFLVLVIVPRIKKDMRTEVAGSQPQLSGRPVEKEEEEETLYSIREIRAGELYVVDVGRGDPAWSTDFDDSNIGALAAGLKKLGEQYRITKAQPMTAEYYDSAPTCALLVWVEELKPASALGLGATATLQ